MPSTPPADDAAPTIETVLFDLDDTLIQYRRSPGEVLQASFEAVGVDALFPVAAYYDRFREFAGKTESMAELRSECFATLASERGHDADHGRAVAEAFAEERDQSNVELRPGVPDALESLAADHRLGIVTNGARDAQQRKIDAVDLDRWMETTVVAGDEVPAKPSPVPFERALDALDATPETTVHVGDSLDSDVAGATAAGLHSVWATDRADRDSDGGGGENSGGGGNEDSDGDALDVADEHQPTYRVDAVADLRTPPWRAGSEPDRSSSTR
ncbi:MAG: HAD family hydrolase [Halopenitus sp.]